MLHDVDKTLENILRTKGKIPKQDIDIEFEQPTGEWAASLSRPALNLFCFDMRENLKLRRAGLDTERTIKDNRHTMRYSRPASRIDLSFLVTAWARKIEDEHQLLWRALHTLKSVPVIKPQDTIGELREQNFDIPVWVADMSIVAQQYNMTDIWSVMENQMRLGFLTLLTVELNLDLEFFSPLVLEGAITVQEKYNTQEGVIETDKPPIKTHRENGQSGGETTPDVRIVHHADEGTQRDE